MSTYTLFIEYIIIDVTFPTYLFTECNVLKLPTRPTLNMMSKSACGGVEVVPGAL